jgi:hypothetical protein
MNVKKARKEALDRSIQSMQKNKKRLDSNKIDKNSNKKSSGFFIDHVTKEIDTQMIYNEGCKKINYFNKEIELDQAIDLNKSANLNYLKDLNNQIDVKKQLVQIN